MSIVMGLDQHRAQITGEWIDTETGEAQRARVAPADRAGWRPRIAPGCGSSCRAFVAGAGGCVGGDDWLAVRGRGALTGWRGGASG